MGDHRVAARGGERDELVVVGVAGERSDGRREEVLGVDPRGQGCELSRSGAIERRKKEPLF